MSRTKTKGKVRIVPGAGDPLTIDADVAASYRGTVRDALGQIIDREIRDPDLREMLNHPRVVLEQSVTSDDGGGAEEQFLSPDQDWRDVLRAAQERDLEVGIGVSHEGGGSERAHEAAGGPVGKVRPDAPRERTRRFPEQAVVYHPSGYELTEDDRGGVDEATDVFITGEALAKAAHLCHLFGSDEMLYYWAAPAEDPYVIDELLLARQRVSAGGCKAEAEDVLALGREARRRGKKVVAAGHSHGYSSLFASGTDWNQMGELAREGVSRTRVRTVVMPGCVEIEPERHHEGEDDA